MQNTPWKIALCGFAVLAVAMGIGRFAFTPLLPMMQDERLISIADGGMLASVHFLGYLMGALFAGYTRDWPSISLYLSLLLIAFSTIAMGTTESFVVWSVARWLAGFCSAIVLVTVSTQLVKRLAELKRPEFQNWVFAGVGGGIFIAGAMALQFLMTGVMSNTAWIVFGVTSLILIAAVYTQIGTAVFETSKPGTKETATKASLDWRLIVPYGATGAGYIIPATYLPIMARNAVESPMLYGLGWPIFGIAAVLSTLLAVRFQSTLSDRQIWIVSQFVMAAGLAIPAIFAGLGAVVLGGICVGGTFMVITMVGMKEAHRITGPNDPQKLIAALTAAFATGQIIGPVVAGWAYEATGDFSYPLLFGSVLLIGSLVPILRN
ncbi:MAG: YbfB/YjiJ family MFS transporter [Rhizobiaceae bacterium]